MPYKLAPIALAVAFAILPSPARAKRVDARLNTKPDTREAPQTREPELEAGQPEASEQEAAHDRERAPERRSKPCARAVSEASPRKDGKKRETKAKAPCFAPEVHVVRKRGTELEHRDLSLTFCDGTPNPAALDSLSVLARPRDIERPLVPEIKAYQRRPTDRGPQQKRRDPAYLAEHVLRVHPGLLERMQKIADHFRGKVIEVISGHRPDARYTSRHHHGRALDLHVQGVSREALRDFARTLDATGVGYYPNGYFVHVDVRDDKGYWVDRSGPGEPADYGPWPPRRDEIERTRKGVIAGALAALSELGEPIVHTTERSAHAAVASDAPRASTEPTPSEPNEEDDELSREEIARIRADALRALEGL